MAPATAKPSACPPALISDFVDGLLPGLNVDVASFGEEILGREIDVFGPRRVAAIM